MPRRGDELGAHRKAIVRETGGHRQRGLTGEAEWRRERAELAGPWRAAERPCGLERRRREQQVEVIPPRGEGRDRVLDGRLRRAHVIVGAGRRAIRCFEHGVVELTALDRTSQAGAHPGDHRRPRRVSCHRQSRERFSPQMVERRRPTGLDVVPERLEQPSHSMRAFDARAVDREPHLRVVVEESDPPPSVGPHDLRARERLEHHREVRCLAGEHEVAPRVARRLAGGRDARDAPARRVEGDKAAQCGRAAQRAGGVRAVRNSHGARRNCRRRSPARSADGTRQIPRVPRRWEARRFGRDRRRQRRAGRLPNDREPELLEARGERSRRRRAAVDVAQGSDTDIVRGRRDLLARVFEQHRHARRRAVEHRRHEEAERRVERLACGDPRIAQLPGAHLPTLEQRPLLDRARPHEVAHDGRGSVRSRA